MRFHVPGVPHTATNKDYVACAFTQKVLNLCKMLRLRNHTVIHYGNEWSDVECTEHVTVTDGEDIEPPEGFLNYDTSGPLYAKFMANTNTEIAKRKHPHDFLLCPWGNGHRPIADANLDMIIVESGIGYPGGYFAPFKVFESYAILHCQYGHEAMLRSGHFRWYDIVIPNAFDPADFVFKQEKEDYLLFLGMRHGGESKGFSVARDAAHDAGCRLIVAGPDSIRGKVDGHVEHAGLVGVGERARLLSGARALIAPSLFLEPFAGVQVEAFFSGTPVISTDWGAF